MQNTLLILLLFFGLSVQAQDNPKEENFDFTGNQYITFTPSLAAATETFGLKLSLDYQKQTHKHWAWGISYDSFLLVKWGESDTFNTSPTFFKRAQFIQGKWSFFQNLGRPWVHIELSVEAGIALALANNDNIYVRPTTSLSVLVDFRVAPDFHLITGLIPFFVPLNEVNAAWGKNGLDKNFRSLGIMPLGFRYQF